MLKLEFILPHVICHDNIAPRVGEVVLWREIMHSLVLSSSAGSAFSGHPSREGVTTATIRAVSGYGVIQPAVLRASRDSLTLVLEIQQPRYLSKDSLGNTFHNSFISMS